LRSGYDGLDRLGQAAAKPSSVMNSRRFITAIIRSPRRRGEQRRRHFDAERLSGLEIDHQLVLGWLLDRKIARLA